MKYSQNLPLMREETDTHRRIRVLTLVFGMGGRINWINSGCRALDIKCWVNIHWYPMSIKLEILWCLSTWLCLVVLTIDHFAGLKVCRGQSMTPERCMRWSGKRLSEQIEWHRYSSPSQLWNHRIGWSSEYSARVVESSGESREHSITPPILFSG